ncbi:Fis family transcriptional regulator [Rhodococcus sp. WMMA185]|uniref:sigma-54-dependent Fis family transcriptional regulator n=1 Tax=Rhodococcus sp. WMMA185 TaxID=679318 RepID=UPI0008789732|nr:helix-turn-helix domain-containing protein [Rhodococcus sp. WMMA185]AOW92519.1 Fis family transcriptional regulator [Rhodococcus sp. WMMA185]
MTITDARQARERFLTEHDLDAAIRESISTSWKRSKALNVRVDRLDLPFVREPDPGSPLMSAAAPVLEQLVDGLSDEPVSVILTGPDGVVLTRIAASRSLNKALDTVNLAPGYSYSEESVGTNGIGTALETRKPTLVTGAEHYSECLEHLACAGVPILHPVSGHLVGALDLTGWVDDGGPLLATLARSATKQIEGRLLTQASAAQTDLLNAYLRACRRSPQSGILALGDDVVLINRRLRGILDAQDQATLVELGLDSFGRAVEHSQVAVLPSGQRIRLSHSGDCPGGTHSEMALLQVHLIDTEEPETRGGGVNSGVVRGLAGSSSSWRSSYEQIASCVREGQWVAVSGEQGSGRCHALKVAATQDQCSITRVFTPEDFRAGADGLQVLAQELEHESFRIILRDLDRLGEAQQAAIVELIRDRQDDGWIGTTIGSVGEEPVVDALILPLFDRTVPVPALRHRIEDLRELVPLLLRQLSHGSEVTMSAQAMRQLCKYSWPGNVEQLRSVLQTVVNRQRSGTIEASEIPPVCRTLSRRTLTRIEALERDAIVRSLEENRGNKKAAAKALGISRATIYRRIKEFGIV